MANPLTRLFTRQQPGEEAAISVAIGAGGADDLPVERAFNAGNAAREGYAGNELVFACIREIATSAADARLTAVKDTTDGPKEVTTGRLAEILEVPDPVHKQTQFQWVEHIHTFLNIAGDVYIHRLRAGIGVVAYELLRPDRVKVVPDGSAVFIVDGTEFPVPAEDFEHLRLPNPTNDFYGLSPLKVLARQVNLDTAATQYTKGVFDNAGIVRGVISLKRRLKSRQEAEDVRSVWRAQFAGVRNWHQIAIMDADASYQQIASDLKDMEIPEIRNLTESRITAAFGVPAILVGANVGLQRSTFANYAEARRSFWEETLMPAYKLIAEFLEMVMLPDFPGQADRLEWDFSQVRALRESQNDLSERTIAEFAGGMLTLDEARAAIGRDSIDGTDGKVRRVPIAVLEVSDGSQVDLIVSAGGVPRQVPAGSDAAQRALPDHQHGPEYVRLAPAQAKRLRLAIDRQFAAHARAIEGAINRAFMEQLNRVDSILGRLIAEDPAEVKVLPFDEDKLVPLEADDALRAAFVPRLVTAMEAVWDTIRSSLGFDVVPFSDELPIVQDVLRAAGDRVVGINQLTRDTLRTTLQQGVDAGYSLRQIAKGVPDDDFIGVRQRVVETYMNRARTIARTEVRSAQNQAAVLRYEAAGITEVDVTDGDEDAECAAANGSRWTLAEAKASPIQHPNCTRGFTPVIPGAD